MYRAFVACFLSLAAPAAAGDLVLGLPIDCDMETTCRIQQYVDRDPGPGFTDFRCGMLSYDGHKGTDFAVPTLADMERGVDVLASADGVVGGVRDGMADVAFTPEREAALDGRDCGNGVAIVHDGGWVTQYCHMRRGSVQVRKGDRVKQGSVLGQVGLSGRSQFPHVHLSVRRDNAVVDPFAATAVEGCGGEAVSLWQDTPAYMPGGLIMAGFSDSIPPYDAVQAGTAAQTELPPDAPALVVFLYAFGGRKGDRLELEIQGPSGQMFQQSLVLDKDQALFFRAGGKRLAGPEWPMGDYQGTVRMFRDETLLGQRQARLQVD